MIDSLNSGAYIFKYYPISYNLVKLFTYNAVWFSSINDFNDPFEAEFSIEPSNEPLEKYATFFYKDYLGFKGEEFNFKMDSIYQEHFEVLYEDLKNSYREYLNKNYNVACFAKEYDNLLLWAHYADSHKGICVIFNKKKLYKLFEKKNIEIIESKDIYIDHELIIKAEFSENKATFIEKEKILHHKNIIWAYENEFRFINKLPYPEANKYIPILPGTIEGVIFGERIKYEDKAFLLYHNHKLKRKIQYFNSKKDIKNNSIQLFKTFWIRNDGFNPILADWPHGNSLTS